MTQSFPIGCTPLPGVLSSKPGPVYSDSHSPGKLIVFNSPTHSTPHRETYFLPSRWSAHLPTIGFPPVSLVHTGVIPAQTALLLPRILPLFRGCQFLPNWTMNSLKEELTLIHSFSNNLLNAYSVPGTGSSQNLIRRGHGAWLKPTKCLTPNA